MLLAVGIPKFAVSLRAHFRPSQQDHIQYSRLQPQQQQQQQLNSKNPTVSKRFVSFCLLFSQSYDAAFVSTGHRWPEATLRPFEQQKRRSTTVPYTFLTPQPTRVFQTIFKPLGKLEQIEQVVRDNELEKAVCRSIKTSAMKQCLAAIPNVHVKHYFGTQLRTVVSNLLHLGNFGFGSVSQTDGMYQCYMKALLIVFHMCTCDAMFRANRYKSASLWGFPSVFRQGNQTLLMPTNIQKQRQEQQQRWAAHSHIIFLTFL